MNAYARRGTSRLNHKNGGLFAPELKWVPLRTEIGSSTDRIDNDEALGKAISLTLHLIKVGPPTMILTLRIIG